MEQIRKLNRYLILKPSLKVIPWPADSPMEEMLEKIKGSTYTSCYAANPKHAKIIAVIEEIEAMQEVK